MANPVNPASSMYEIYQAAEAVDALMPNSQSGTLRTFFSVPVVGWGAYLLGGWAYNLYNDQYKDYYQKQAFARLSEALDKIEINEKTPTGLRDAYQAGISRFTRNGREYLPKYVLLEYISAVNRGELPNQIAEIFRKELVMEGERGARLMLWHYGLARSLLQNPENLVFFNNYFNRAKIIKLRIPDEGRFLKENIFIDFNKVQELALILKSLNRNEKLISSFDTKIVSIIRKRYSANTYGVFDNALEEIADRRKNYKKAQSLAKQYDINPDRLVEKIYSLARYTNFDKIIQKVEKCIQHNARAFETAYQAWEKSSIYQSSEELLDGLMRLEKIT